MRTRLDTRNPFLRKKNLLVDQPGLLRKVREVVVAEGDQLEGPVDVELAVVAAREVTTMKKMPDMAVEAEEEVAVAEVEGAVVVVVELEDVEEVVKAAEEVEDDDVITKTTTSANGTTMMTIMRKSTKIAATGALKAGSEGMTTMRRMRSRTTHANALLEAKDFEVGVLKGVDGPPEEDLEEDAVVEEPKRNAFKKQFKKAIS